MRIRWPDIVVVVLVMLSSATARNHLALDVTLDASSNTISGSVTLTAIAEAELKDVRFRLYPNLFCDSADNCGIVVDSLLVNGHSLTEAMKASGTDLHAVLSEVVPEGEILKARLWFTSHIPPRLGRYGYAEDQYTLTAWFPMPAPLKDGEWQHVNYQPFLEPSGDLHDIEAVIRFPDTLQCIVPGECREMSDNGQTTTHVTLGAASDLPLIIASDYLLETVSHDSIMIRFYYRKADRFVLDSVHQAVTFTLDYMSDMVMPYPFDEFTVVIGGLTEGGGLELPRMILMFAPPGSLISRAYTVTVIHEVIHQWFYGILNSSQAVNPWMDEGITEYFTMKISREMTGGAPDLLNIAGWTASYDVLQRPASRSVVETQPVSRVGDQFYSAGEYSACVYNKGALTIRTLTTLMGPGKEKQFWHEYTAGHKFTTPEPEDFVRLADKYLPESEQADTRTLLNSLAPLDWQVMSLSSERITAQFDSSDSSGAEEISYKVEVEYVAVHPPGFPVTMRIEFLDGTANDTLLRPSPGTHSLSLTTTSPAVTAIIDPERKYATDINLLNNSLAHDKSQGAGLRLFSGATFLVQSFFSCLWGF